MAKFRTKPFIIDAVLFDGANLVEVDEFTGKHGMFIMVEPEDRTDDPEIIASVFDKLHSTWVGVKQGQWIIKGQKGEYYPCDPEIFAAKYEAVEGNDFGDKAYQPDIKKPGKIRGLLKKDKDEL